MTRECMKNILLNNPYLHISHRYFSENEYIYSKTNGKVYDENGYLFEDWHSDSVTGHIGIRMRYGGYWDDGWYIKSVQCSKLKYGVEVVFMLYSDIYKRKVPEIGTVISVSKNNKTVGVTYMEGYKQRFDDIPYEDMLAVHSPHGKMMKFENIIGLSIGLLAE